MYVIIVGAGKLGYQLSEIFSIKENNVAVVDINEEALAKATANIDLLSVQANGLNLKTLEELNVETCDLLIAVTSSDEINMLTATLAKKIGCKKVIARIRQPENALQTDFLKEQLDINYVCNPEFEVAKEIAKNMLRSEAVHMEDFAKGKVGMHEISLDHKSPWIDKPLKDLDFPRKALVVAVLRNAEMFIPNGSTVLKDHDTIYLIGVKEQLQQFSKKTLSLLAPKKVRKAMILGGGKAAYYLAKMLLEAHVVVKIIERDKERCKYLAESLDDALIIHGDATDINLLVEEDIDEMDSLVLLTGYDEENLLLSMVAKKHQVSKIITKVSKRNYVHLIEQLGIEMVVNPILVSAAGIMRHIQGGRLLSISMLLGGYAEVMEIIAAEGSHIVGKPIHKLNLPEGIIIGAVVKKKKVFIPDGNTIIEDGNRVIVFCLKEEIHKIEAYFYQTKRGILNEFWNRGKSYC